MRNKLLLYLFIFTLLSGIFIYVNDKKILDARDEEIAKLEERVSRIEKEKTSLQKQNEELVYFSLESNEEAMTYFEDMGIEVGELLSKLENELIGRNKAGEDNPLVPFEGMEGPMRINNVKILNHKWIIADFTDGSYWGEVFFTYEVEENGGISFSPEKSFLYPRD